LHTEPQAAETQRCRGDRIVGLAKVEWVPFAPPELPGEQSADDGRSLVFDSAPLADPLEMLGAPVFRVRVAADRPHAKIAVRLCEVTPEGKSWLVSYGLLNLTHRDGHDEPKLLKPGLAYEVAVPLNFTAHRFAKGRRVRIAVSESLWPLVWPSPEIATLTLDLASARLELPERPVPSEDAPMPIASVLPRAEDPSDWPVMTITDDHGVARIVETWPNSEQLVADIGETVSGSGPNVVLSTHAADPSSCAWSAEQSVRFRRPGWDVSIRAEVEVRASSSHFDVTERTLATLNGETLADVAHRTRIARRFM
jgi:hypothetical protein